MSRTIDDSHLLPEELAIKAEWDVEIAHRIADHEAGLTKSIPAEES